MSLLPVNHYCVVLLEFLFQSEEELCWFEVENTIRWSSFMWPEWRCAKYCSYYYKSKMSYCHCFHFLWNPVFQILIMFSYFPLQPKPLQIQLTPGWSHITQASTTRMPFLDNWLLFTTTKVHSYIPGQFHFLRQISISSNQYFKS